MSALSALARHAFRKSTARPFPVTGAGGWLARRPPWLVGLVVALAWVIAVGSAAGGSIAWHHWRVPTQTVWGLSGQIIVAAGAGLFWALVWKRQLGSFGARSAVLGDF